MFAASKLLSFAVEPLFWVLVFLLPGALLLARRPRLAKGLVWAALLALVLSGWTFVPDTVLHQLESRYRALPADADMRKYAGVVVLGGALSNSKLWTTHRQVALNEQAERMTAAVGLARQHPRLKLLFTGGIASVPPIGLTEAERAKMFFDQMGVDPSQVVYEAKSRNTFENASFSAGLPGVDKRQPWLLLTSAFHMPRSMGVFLKNGWNVTPYPVDYRTTSQPAWFEYSLSYGPGLWGLALHEVLGYVVYQWAGMI